LLQNNGRAQFGASQDYTLLSQDQAAQATLWAVPSINDLITPAQLVKNARIISTMLQELTQCVAKSAEQFFAWNSVSFIPKKNHGLGDLDVQGFVRWKPQEEYDIESFFGVSIPTGKKTHYPNYPFVQPLGNNGHWEVQIGAWFHARPCAWLDIDIDSLYCHVLKAREQLPTAFVGAMVKNIGKRTSGTVSWGYYLGHADLTFTCPGLTRHHNVQLQLGYELYHKQKDSIHFHQQQAVDFFGNLQNLNPRLLEYQTTVTSNKIGLQLSYAYSNCIKKSIGICGGANFVVGGKNVPQEHDWHIGFEICL
jgi:hypothetical protein